MFLWFRRIGVIVVILLFAMQIIRPARTNPPVDSSKEIHASLTLEPGTTAVLERSCDDCHSNRTKWPWYSEIAPASWLVVSDVNEGRRELNFSEWGTYTPEKQQKRLRDICKEVTERDMPAFQYTLIHWNAKLSGTEIDEVCRWTQAASQTLASSTRK